MSTLLIQSATLVDIGDAIREKLGTDIQYKPSEMPDAIREIQGETIEKIKEVKVIDLHYGHILARGNLYQFFENDLWDKYFSPWMRVKTEDVCNFESGLESCYNLVDECKELVINFCGSDEFHAIKEKYPYTLVIGMGPISITRAFAYDEKMTVLPTFNFKPNTILRDLGGLFYRCYELSAEEMDKLFPNLDLFSHITSWRSWVGGYVGGSTFAQCYSMERLPNWYIPMLKKIKSSDGGDIAASQIFQELFYECVNLREVKNLPLPKEDTIQTNGAIMPFYTIVGSTPQLEHFTFEPNQELLLHHNLILAFGSTGYVRYSMSTDMKNIYDRKHTSANEVKDLTTYNALKSNPDWWTKKAEFSKYNHDSAVETINSLPTVTFADDTVTAKTAILQFKSGQGSGYGKSINDLTDAEIGVAISKGWTISFI